MAQNILIPIADDNEVLNASPLTLLQTLYYELWYNIVGNTNATQLIADSPLDLYTTVSPAGSTPCIVIGPLPENTSYQFKVRRFDLNNNPSDWYSGTFTTGQNNQN